MGKIMLSPAPSTMHEAEFVETYGAVYEHSPWIAREAWRRGLGTTEDDAEGLAQAMAAVLAQASAERQLEVIRLHPDLAGKAAVQKQLTEHSSREQAGAGLDQCTPEEFARFQDLNRRYKERFGFPFVMAVRGFDRHQILQAFEQRLDNDIELERRTAIEQVNRIARLRLFDLAGAEAA